jgi:peptidoglycan L-alanyl-D-glutamate endopeptidase CwlK
MFYLSKKSLSKLEGVDERLQKIVKEAIKETKVDFAVVSGYRTAEKQNELYKKGYSELDGYTKKSAHQLGKAVDIVPYKDGKLCWNIKKCPREWLEIGRVMLRQARKQGVCLEWGLTYNLGNNTTYDPAHFEIKE